MKQLSLYFLLIFFLALAGQAQEIASPPRRIISIAPSTTEILFALGLDERIIGVSSFCDHPEAAKKKPKIGGMSNPSLEAIVALKPDLVVMSTDGNPREIDERLRSMNIRTYVFTARVLSDLPAGIRALGSAVGEQRNAELLSSRIEKGIAAISQKKPAERNHRKALFIVWPEPLIVAGPGTAIDDAIKLLDLENVASQSMTSYPRFSIEEVIRQGPEILFIGKASGMDMGTVSKGILAKVSTIPAVKSGAICFVGDGLYRLGPRVIQGIEELAECVRSK